MKLTVIGCILLACSLSVVLGFQGPTAGSTGANTAVPPMDSSTALDNAKLTNPLKKKKKPKRICLMVEPTPFTHVSGYANRFKEMLKFLNKAGDQVDILTVDSKTPAKDLPKQFMGYPIRHTLGFTFPLYNHISLTIDLPEMKGAKIIENFRPDVIHVTSPGFLLFAAIFYARTMKIPLVMSYHTHLPTYGTQNSILCFLAHTTCREKLFRFYSARGKDVLGFAALCPQQSRFDTRDVPTNEGRAGSEWNSQGRCLAQRH